MSMMPEGGTGAELPEPEDAMWRKFGKIMFDDENAVSNPRYWVARIAGAEISSETAKTEDQTTGTAAAPAAQVASPWRSLPQFAGVLFEADDHNGYPTVPVDVDEGQTAMSGVLAVLRVVQRGEVPTADVAADDTTSDFYLTDLQRMPLNRVPLPPGHPEQLIVMRSGGPLYGILGPRVFEGTDGDEEHGAIVPPRQTPDESSSLSMVVQRGETGVALSQITGEQLTGEQTSRPGLQVKVTDIGSGLHVGLVGAIDETPATPTLGLAFRTRAPYRMIPPPTEVVPPAQAAPTPTMSPKRVRAVAPPPETDDVFATGYEDEDDDVADDEDDAPYVAVYGEQSTETVRSQGLGGVMGRLSSIGKPGSRPSAVTLSNAHLLLRPKS